MLPTPRQSGREVPVDTGQHLGPAIGGEHATVVRNVLRRGHVEGGPVEEAVGVRDEGLDERAGVVCVLLLAAVGQGAEPMP